MVVASYDGDAAPQLERGAFAPWLLTGREKSTVSPTRSESTASNDAYSDSAAGASASESTRPTSVPTHRDSSTSVSPSRDACENPNRVGPTDGEASEPSCQGPRRAPSSRRRYDVEIIDARADSAQPARSTTGPKCYNGRPGAPSRFNVGRHRDSHWSKKSHPIPYRGCYARVRQRDTASLEDLERSNSHPSADPSQEQPPCREDLPLPFWLREDSIASSRSQRSAERKRRVEEWVDDASGLIRRLLSPSKPPSLSDGSIRHPQLRPEAPSALGALGIHSKSAADDWTLRRRIRGAWTAAPRLSGGSVRTTAAGQPGCQASASPEAQAGNASRGSSSNKRSVVAGARRMEQIPEEDGEDDQQEVPQPGPKGGKGKETDAFFACPYFKHDPVKYVGREWRSCCGPGWEEVRRVKEHLYRHHRQPRDRCKRCGECFEGEHGLDAHIRREEPCELLRKPLQVEGFDAKQEAQLRSRKRPIVGLSEVEKWRQVYTVLFPRVPEEQIPSPFYEYVEFQHPSSLSDYEEYALREMDGDLRPTLEHGLEADLGLVEPADKQRAVKWFKEMQHRLLNEFKRRRRRPSSTASPEKPPGYLHPTSSIASPPTATSSSNTLPEPWRLLPEWSTEEEQLFDISPDTVYAEAFSLAAGAGGVFNLDGPNSLDDFDFDYCYRTSVTLEVEPSPSASDSAYGSMSTKDSSGCPPEGGEEA